MKRSSRQHRSATGNPTTRGAGRRPGPAVLAVLALLAVAGATAWLVIGASGDGGGARAVGPDEPDARAVKAAVRDYLRALEDNDLDRARSRVTLVASLQPEHPGEGDRYLGARAHLGAVEGAGPGRATVAVERLAVVRAGEGCRLRRGGQLDLARTARGRWRIASFDDLPPDEPCACPAMPWPETPGPGRDRVEGAPASRLRPLEALERATASSRLAPGLPAQPVGLGPEGWVDWGAYPGPAAQTQLNLYFAETQRVRCVEVEATRDGTTPRPTSLTVTAHGTGPYGPRQLTLGGLDEAGAGVRWRREALPAAPGLTLTINGMEDEAEALPELRVRLWVPDGAAD